MKLTKKEEYLLKNGKNLKTIEFCKKCNISQNHIVWFVDRIEKEKLNLEELEFDLKIKKVCKLFEIDPKQKCNSNTLVELINYSNEHIEDDSNIKSRIIHKFKNGFYILNLSHKELCYEGYQMSNCLGDMKEKVLRKEKVILALKDNKDKTLCDLEVDNLGVLRQHYEKANAPINFEKWKYINEFFEIYKDEEFSKAIDAIDIDSNYDINPSNTHNNIPIIEYFIPTSFTVSASNLNKKEIKSVNYVKDFVNTNRFNKKINSKNLQEVVSYLNEYKEYINDSIEKLIETVSYSNKNYYVLNEKIIEKLFNKKPLSFETRLHEIIEGFNNRMTITYEGGLLLEEPLYALDGMVETGDEDMPMPEPVGMDEEYIAAPIRRPENRNGYIDGVRTAFLREVENLPGSILVSENDTYRPFEEYGEEDSVKLMCESSEENKKELDLEYISEQIKKYELESLVEEPETVNLKFKSKDVDYNLEIE